MHNRPAENPFDYQNPDVGWILRRHRSMELKFVRQWKFSTRNNNHTINPVFARRALIIRSDDDFSNQDVVNDNDSDESDSML